jgi:hypothetical protein
MSDDSKPMKTWKLHPDGHTLGEMVVISPWTGEPAEAVVDLDANEVVAIHGATCQPFQLAVPRNLFEAQVIALGGRIDDDDDDDPPPYALTDRHVAELERAIRAEGYDILTNPQTLDVKLVKMEL